MVLEFRDPQGSQFIESVTHSFMIIIEQNYDR